MDVQISVNAVMHQRLRRFGGRLVRGEPTPPVTELVDAATARLARLVIDRVDPANVEKEVRRYLDAGRRPFDVLTSPT